MKIQKYGIVGVKKYSFFLFSLISLGTLFLSGCFGGSSSISSLKIVNVLDPENYQDCHIKGSINIPFEHLDDAIKTLPKNAEYVFYCSNYACTAAPFAAKTLQEMGFKNVAFYPGGIVEWYQKGYPYSGPATMDYLKEENELIDEEGMGVSIISADELLAKMKKFEIIK